MRIALIADVFPPLRSSGAVQLRDLSLELMRQGHQPTVMIPAPDLDAPWVLESMQGVRVLRLKAPKTKDVGYVRRTVNELLMPFAMLKNLRKSPLSDEVWDGIVWYSPTIFLGPMASALKKSSNCRSYLIVRDIFPEWAVDMGLMGRGLPYRFFKRIERYQYSVANVIGVQTSSNLSYFSEWACEPGRRVEVLQNWLADASDVGCSISVANGPLAGRTIFVYAGNMGVAQGMGILIELADRMRGHNGIGFLFVGRGSDAQQLRDDAKARGLSNVVFHDEIDPSEVAGLCAQCHVGIVALDPRHKTHNIPGKFLTYMQNGLPVLASVNLGNDLAELIESERVGRVCTDHSVDTLMRLVLDMVPSIENNDDVPNRCRAVAAKLFSPNSAVLQITTALVDA
jgi:glycosyltransferase involved in cell wall biosynthesis